MIRRAELLRPSDELVSRALRRCIRHKLRTSRRTAPPSAAAHAETLISAVPATPPANATPSYAPGEVPAAAVLGATPPLEARPGTVSPAVAMAVTMSDSHAPTSGTSSGTQRQQLAAGREIAGYRIESQIGVGGMGQVYRATQLSMNRSVALKILSPRLAASPRFRDRFQREARAAGRLHHPNLIAVHDVGEVDGMMFFSMEIVEGSSVKELINELGTLPEDRAIDITRQCLRALGYAHDHGIVHRDIKPDNLMLTTSGLVKVADLGLSKVDSPLEDSFTTQAGTMMGTPYYMAPEQGRDAHRADARADLYAVGATLYHMVCGKVPFEGETPVAILINASTQPLNFPEPGPSPSVRRVIAMLMEKKAVDRPRTTAEALAQIDRLTAPGGAEVAARELAAAPRVVSERLRSARLSNRHAYPTRARRRRRRYSLISASALAFAAMLVVGAFALRGRDDITARVEALVGERHYQAALDEIAAAGGKEHAGLARDVAEAWNAWAEPRATEHLAAIERGMARGNAVEVQAAIAAFPDEFKSPRVRDVIDRQVFALQRLVDGGGAEGASLRWWRDAFADVSGVDVDPDGTTFRERGSAPLASMPRRADGGAGFALRVRLRDAVQGDRWRVVVGAHRVIVRGDGLLIEESGNDPRHLIGPDKEGWVAFAMACDKAGWFMKVGTTSHKLSASAEVEPAIDWALADGASAVVALDGR
ncbi:MAG TPA: protein kinase [Planctomycetota bacterium]|nr:protein kinase [Planctomycetota bacterium]